MMRDYLDCTGRQLVKVIRRFCGDEAGEISDEVGFHFSAWFFATLVLLAFLDAYVFEGRGFSHYFDMPYDALDNARAMLKL